jgi:hypothetical protein
LEKRKERRIKRRILANLEKHSAITNDISENGMQISMGTNPKTILVNIQIDLEKDKYNLTGKVKWIKRNPIKKTSTIGISIDSFPDDYKKKLSKLFPFLEIDNETDIEIEEINDMFGI